MQQVKIPMVDMAHVTAGNIQVLLTTKKKQGGRGREKQVFNPNLLKLKLKKCCD